MLSAISILCIICRLKKLEKEYERRQQEIMLEAEAAVKAREEALNQELSRLREELERQRSMQNDYIQVISIIYTLMMMSIIQL